MASTDKIVQDLKEAITSAGAKKTEAYDTPATVRRIEGGTAWVHIPGGVDETPVKMTIAASVGDTVQVRVSGGRAFLVGNGSAPPTDDTTAIISKSIAQAAQKTANNAIVMAEEALENSGGSESSYFWYKDGTSSEAGAHITPIPREDFEESPIGGNTLIRSLGMYIRDGLKAVAKFLQSGIQLGEDDAAHVNIDYHSLQMFDREAIQEGDKPFVWLSDFRDEDGETQLVQSFDGDGESTDYPLQWSVVSVDEVYINGTLTTAYTYADGEVSFNVAPADGSVIEIVYTSDTREAKAFTFGSRKDNSYLGLMSLSEGVDNEASGYASHAEGVATTAYGGYAHAEGALTSATGFFSHAGGLGTEAAYDAQTAIGVYNDSQPDDIFEVGNGDANTPHNAFSVTADGEVKATVTYNPYALGQEYSGGFCDEGLLIQSTRNKWHVIFGEEIEN